MTLISSAAGDPVDLLLAMKASRKFRTIDFRSSRHHGIEPEPLAGREISGSGACARHHAEDQLV
ncbi:MAG: hypothetical protein IPN03_05965 [Holophagales bacterium]|nr:hypothetical protein [Holophagales bacterium]